MKSNNDNKEEEEKSGNGGDHDHTVTVWKEANNSYRSIDDEKKKSTKEENENIEHFAKIRRQRTDSPKLRNQFKLKLTKFSTV